MFTLEWFNEILWIDSMPRHKIFVTGDSGQLGSQIMASLQGYQLISASSHDFDLANLRALSEKLDSIRPDIVVNCAAYTAVDQAEQEPERAHAVNADGVGVLAQWCAHNECYLAHISTDYVFSGSKPLFECYSEGDATKPQTVYGKSKLQGETNIASVEGLNYCILRTAWLYSASGENFLNKIRNLAESDPSRELKIVHDQYGSPTPVRALARQIQVAVDEKLHGLYHASAGGYCSWFDFASAAMQQFGIECNLKPCSSEEYPTLAQRPKNSILCNRRLADNKLDTFLNWQDELAAFSNA